MNTITEQDLLDFGMFKTDDPVIPFEKILGQNKNGKVSIVVTTERNMVEFAIFIPGGLLFLDQRTTLRNLKVITKCLSCYELFE